MAATVQSKGSGGGAPPSYVKTPASWFIVSLPVDRRLARYDIAGSLAHVEMLAAVGPMPGYTHLQRAQPVTVGHHLLAHVWPLIRDDLRLADGFGRANVSPLGAGALAGSTLPIDPAISARILGFAGPFENSIDAVGDRDHFVEFVFDLSLLAVHLSSIAEEIVVWASQEFGFLRPTQALGSGSSLMPQKRNPDVAELVRGKTGRFVGDLVSLLTTLKGLPVGSAGDLEVV